MDQAERLRSIIKQNQVAPAKAARVITVTSGKGGVGKSNTAINLAVEFKKMGKRVIIFDADFGLANIEVMFGTIPKNNLADLIYQGKGIKDVITWGPMDVGFISGGSGIAGLTNLGREYINYLVQQLSELDTIADVVIIDTGAGISDSVMEFLVASGEVILVTTPEPTSITDSYSLLKALRRNPGFKEDASSIKVISNKVATSDEGALLFKKLNAVVVRYLHLNIEYLGCIPQDNELSEAVMQQSPVTISNPNAKSSKAYKDIAMTLMDIPHEAQVYRRGMAGFFANMVRGKHFS
ncbi:MAG: MinD/ParA family protein [Lachnospiraceae bacterium]|nr:MinD/ParA family protein [Lachnospiraceae bacterium]MBR1875938.1 MinD/ParA family protein [Lachnospiraceae bacterium]